MEQQGRVFDYKGNMRDTVVGLRMLGLACVALATVFAGWMAAVSLSNMDSPNPWFIGIFLSGIIFFAGWDIGLYMVNLFPTIEVNATGLTLSTLVLPAVKIPWEAIVETRDCRPWRYCYGAKIIHARRITLYHYFYGMQYLGFLAPIFLIHPSIDSYGDLLSEIQHRVDH